MDAGLCWELFCATGEPMAYVLYCGSADDVEKEEEYDKELQEFTQK